PALAVLVRPARAEVGVGDERGEEGEQEALARDEVGHAAAAGAGVAADVAADRLAVDGEEAVGLGAVERRVGSGEAVEYEREAGAFVACVDGLGASARLCEGGAALVLLGRGVLERLAEPTRDGV